SLSPSPTRLMASTVISIASPGKALIHQAERKAVLPAPIMYPQLMTLGSLSPMKLRADSVRMEVATISEPITTMGPVALGKICMMIICILLSPDRAAALTKSCSFRERNSPRTRRATGGHDTTAIAVTMEARLG